MRLLLLFWYSDKFGERTNIPKLSENTAQLMCTLDITQFAYIQISWEKTNFFQDVSNSDFGAVL